MVRDVQDGWQQSYAILYALSCVRNPQSVAKQINCSW